MNLQNTSAFILAAGLGTRLKPFTDHHPKALCPVNGKTLLERSIEKMVSFGVKNIVINVYHFADQIIEFINSRDWGIEIIISDERPEVLETGGGLLFAKPFLQKAEHILIWNVDILTHLNIEDAFKIHLENKAMATLFVSERDSSRKLLWKNNKLVGWKNINSETYRWVKKPKEHYIAKAFSGIHFVKSDIFNHFVHEGKFSIIDTYFDLAKYHVIQHFDHTGQLIIDVGRPESVIDAESLFK